MTTNYEAHLGTPEKAAKLIARLGDSCNGMECDYAVCKRCPLGNVVCDDADCVLLWMKEEADER